MYRYIDKKYLLYSTKSQAPSIDFTCSLACSCLYDPILSLRLSFLGWSNKVFLYFLILQQLENSLSFGKWQFQQGMQKMSYQSKHYISREPSPTPYPWSPYIQYILYWATICHPTFSHYIQYWATICHPTFSYHIQHWATMYPTNPLSHHTPLTHWDIIPTLLTHWTTAPHLTTSFID